MNNFKTSGLENHNFVNKIFSSLQRNEKRAPKKPLFPLLPKAILQPRLAPYAGFFS